MITEHVYTAEVAGEDSTRFSVTDGTVTLDESWSPYVQASVRLAIPDAATLEALDPRTDARVRLTMVQRFGRGFTLATVTAGSGSSTAAWTADLDGGPLSAWTGRYGRPYNSFGIRPSTRRRCNLGVRRRRVDWGAGVVDLDLASDEALLQDYANATTSPIVPANATVRAAVQLVLSFIGAALTVSPDDGALEADAIAWQPGVSAWDYVAPLVQAAGLRLYCDERRDWHLVKPLAPTEGALTFGPGTFTVLEDELSRDDGWFDAVVIRYRWRNAANVEQVRYDVATTPGYSRVMTLEYERPWPGDGAAAAILARARGRGRVEALSAVSNYNATPGQALSITQAGQPTQTGLASRVTWSLTADEMQVRSRDLIDTPANAWALIPAGVAWEDIPADMSWDELDVTQLVGGA